MSSGRREGVALEELAPPGGGRAVAVGPPSVVAEHLERDAEAGVETFVTRFTAADHREQLRRFADGIA